MGLDLILTALGCMVFGFWVVFSWFAVMAYVAGNPHSIL